VTDIVDAEDALRHELTLIWREVLLFGPMDPDIDFLELDGSSLTAIRIAARVRERTGHEIDFDVLFDYPRPRLLAGLLSTGGAAADQDGPRSGEGDQT
jgi:hypothetical protein